MMIGLFLRQRLERHAERMRSRRSTHSQAQLVSAGVLADDVRDLAEKFGWWVALHGAAPSAVRDVAEELSAFHADVIRIADRGRSCVVHPIVVGRWRALRARASEVEYMESSTGQ